MSYIEQSLGHGETLIARAQFQLVVQPQGLGGLSFCSVGLSSAS